MRALLLIGLAWTTLLFAIEVPYLSGPLVDEVGLVNADERAQIETMLHQLDESKRAQMAILIVPDLQGETIESFALAVAEKWALGEKGKDQGLLFVVAPNDRKMRMEVGRGLEGEIPDIITQRIQRDQVAPFFRENRHAEGLMVAIREVAARVGVSLEAPIEGPPPRPARNPDKLGLFTLILLVMFLLFIGSISRRSRRRFGRRYYDSGWSSGGWGGGGWGGSGGGGGFSGGGGGFSGGGSSSSW